MPKRRAKGGGAPGWMVTFADLMALMLTFFVLLLSMSVLDVQRFQAALLSVQGAFGQPWHNEGGAAGYIIGDYLSPPTPLPIEEKPPVPEPEPILDEPVTPNPAEPLYQELRAALDNEINQEYLELERSDLQVLIRFRQQISFPLASADLQHSFIPILDKIALVLKGIEGSIVVVGHTDDLPISTARFRSNWDLSSARAASVVHYLLENSELATERVIAAGRADTQPLLPNTSMANRDKNRRVEVVIRPEDGPGTRRRIDEELFQ
jgi:chemotaxis protein MotB